MKVLLPTGSRVSHAPAQLHPTRTTLSGAQSSGAVTKLLKSVFWQDTGGLSTTNTIMTICEGMKFTLMTSFATLFLTMASSLESGILSNAMRDLIQGPRSPSTR